MVNTKIPIPVYLFFFVAIMFFIFGILKIILNQEYLGGFLYLISSIPFLLSSYLYKTDNIELFDHKKRNLFADNSFFMLGFIFVLLGLLYSYHIAALALGYIFLFVGLFRRMWE